MVLVTDGTWEARSHILHILKPSRNDPDIIDAQEELVLDAKLLEKVIQAPIFTTKSIPHACCLVFPKRLKKALYQVVTEPSSVGVWVPLSLLPHCTLQVDDKSSYVILSMFFS